MSRHWHEVHAHLIKQTARADFHRQFRAMARRQADLSGFADPGAVLDFLHGGAGTGAGKNAVLRALVRDVQSGNGDAEAASTLAVLALWPGLDAIRKRLHRFFHDDPELLAAELMGRLSQIIAAADLARVTWIAATFLRNIERDIKRDLARQTDEACDLWMEDRAGVGEGSLPSGEGVLERLRSHIGPDANLVLAVAVFGFSQKEAARALGLSHDAARKRYQRAISRLSAVVDSAGL